MTDRPLNLAIFDMGLLKAPFFLGLKEHLAPTINCLYWSRRLLMRRYAQSAGIPILPTSLAEPRLPCRIADDELRRAIGIKEQMIFPEINYDMVEQIHGMDITFVTTAEKDAHAMALLHQLGMPFRGDDKPVIPKVAQPAASAAAA